MSREHAQGARTVHARGVNLQVKGWPLDSVTGERAVLLEALDEVEAGFRGLAGDREVDAAAPVEVVVALSVAAVWSLPAGLVNPLTAEGRDAKGQLLSAWVEEVRREVESW